MVKINNQKNNMKYLTESKIVNVKWSTERTPGSAETIKFMASKSCQVTSKKVNIDLVIKKST